MELDKTEVRNIQNRIELLKKITVEHGATLNEAKIAEVKIKILETKLAENSGEVEKIKKEQSRATSEALLNRLNNLLNKEWNDYNMGQHEVVIGDLEDVDKL